MTKAAPSPSLARRARAVGVVLLAAAVYGYLVGRPAATAKVGEQAWAPLKPGESLTLVLPAGAAAPSVFRFRGPIGRNVGVEVPQGVLDSSALLGIVPIPPQTAGRPVPVHWQLDQGGATRAIVEVGLKPVGPRPRLAFQPVDDPNVSQLLLKADDAQLQVRMSGVATGGRNDPAAQLTVDDPAGKPLRIVIAAGGALPLPVTAPPGTPVTISYAQDAAADRKGPGFTLGPDGTLAVAALHIDSPAGPVAAADAVSGSRLYACGAPPKDPRQWFPPAEEVGRVILWGRLDRIACHPTLGVSFGPEGFTPQVSGGPAFLAIDGKVQTVSWETIKSNPFLSGFLVLIPPALAGWAFHQVFAPLLFGGKRRAKPSNKGARPPGSRRGRPAAPRSPPPAASPPAAPGPGSSTA